MENRSHAIFAGLFVIALAIAGIVAALWIDRKDVNYTPYKIVSIYPVGGLSTQSDVRYMGVTVGKVLDVGISAAHPGSVNIVIGLFTGTPITKETWAEIQTQGVTGISNIELRDSGMDKTRVESRDGELYVIPTRPGFFQELQKLGTGTIEDIDRIVDQVEKLLTDQNVAAFTAVLTNIETLTASLNRTVKSLDPTFKKLPKLVDSLDLAASSVTELAKDANATVEMLNAPSGPMRQAAKSLERVQQIASQLQGSTLPEIDQLTESLNLAAQAFTQVVKELKQSPQSLIYGSPQVEPGPGEPGFTGFNQ